MSDTNLLWRERGNALTLHLSGYRYSAFTDPAGGSGGDSFTVAVGHMEGTRIYCDAVREITSPFQPESAVDEIVSLLRRYGITRVTGDRYAGSWPSEQFSKRGIKYLPSPKVKSDLYRDLLPLLNSGSIVLPKHQRLANQLCGLERRVSRGGKDSIDHAPGRHDDIANSVAGLASLVSDRRYNAQASWSVWGSAPDTPRKHRWDGELVGGGFAKAR